MISFRDTRLLVGAYLVALAGAGAGRELAAQQPGAHLGITAAGSLGVFAGGGSAVHDLKGGEGGLSLDLGWIGAPRVRLVSDAAWFVGHLREYVSQDDREYSGSVFDLAGTVLLQVQGGSASRRFVPYASLGLAVHALSSAFGSLPLDQRYNANRFGTTGAVGAQLWVGAAGRQSLFLEIREQQVTAMSRWTVRAGLAHHFAPLVRPARR